MVKKDRKMVLLHEWGTENRPSAHLHLHLQFDLLTLLSSLSQAQAKKLSEILSNKKTQFHGQKRKG
jgi:hypothetical protein